MRNLPPFKPFEPIDHGNRREEQRDKRQGQSPDNNATGSGAASQSFPPALWLALALSVAGCFLPAKGCEFTWPAPGPSPSPAPEPTPDVVVDPAKTKGSWVLLLEETAERTPEITRVVVNESFWGGLEGRGLKYRLIDRDSASFEPYQNIASEVGLPCILILSPSGEVLTKTPLPKTTGELDQLVEKVTGR